MPTHFTQRPELPFYLHFAWDAFWELNSERQIGFGLGPIPARAIREHADAAGITGDALESFRAAIRAMDAEYLKRRSSK